MELRSYLRLLRRRWPLILLTVLILTVGAFFSTPKTTAYAAKSRIYVGTRVLQADDLSSDRSTAIARLLVTFAVMIKSETIAAQAVERSGIERSAGQVVAQTQAVPIIDTQLLEITVTDPDPAMARTLANALAESFVEGVQQFEPDIAPGEGAIPTLPAYVFESARLPTTPLPNDESRTVVVAAIFGLMLSVSMILLAEYLDVTIKTPDDAERHLELPVLGAIPADPKSAGQLLVRSTSKVGEPRG